MTGSCEICGRELGDGDYALMGAATPSGLCRRCIRALKRGRYGYLGCAQAEALRIISENPGIGTAELSRAMGVSMPRICQLTKTLEGKGEITRDVSPDNRTAGYYAEGIVKCGAGDEGTRP